MDFGRRLGKRTGGIELEETIYIVDIFHEREDFALFCSFCDFFNNIL